MVIQPTRGDSPKVPTDFFTEASQNLEGRIKEVLSFVNAKLVKPIEYPEFFHPPHTVEGLYERMQYVGVFGKYLAFDFEARGREREKELTAAVEDARYQRWMVGKLVEENESMKKILQDDPEEGDDC